MFSHEIKCSFQNYSNLNLYIFLTCRKRHIKTIMQKMLYKLYHTKIAMHNVLCIICHARYIVQNLLCKICLAEHVVQNGCYVGMLSELVAT